MAYLLVTGIYGKLGLMLATSGIIVTAIFILLVAISTRGFAPFQCNAGASRFRRDFARGRFNSRDPSTHE